MEQRPDRDLERTYSRAQFVDSSKIAARRATAARRRPAIKS